MSDIYAGVPDATLRADIEEMQNIQRRNPPASSAWKAASRYLNACAAELARRDVVRIRLEGAEARKAGARRWDNPYQSSADAWHFAWFAGWDEADKVTQ